MDQIAKEVFHRLAHAGIHEGGHHLMKKYNKWADSPRSNPYAKIEETILDADDVTIDFSDWSEADLNPNTTCSFFGIPNGNIRFGGFIGVEKFLCDTLDKQKVAVHLYKWCRARSTASSGQRSFRFKKGKYVGEGRLVSTGAAAFGVAALGVASYLVTSLVSKPRR